MGTLTATLTASDPQGESVMISGDVDGNAFACPSGDTNCWLSLSNEGIGTVNYTVNSATGLSSTGTTNYKLDTASPQIDGSLSGVIGSNGWYVSDVDLSASASDDVSGLASFSMTIDGGTSTNYADATFSDGVHTVVMTATDNAGNNTQTSQTFSIDTLTPSLDLSLSGTMGSNGWYSSSVQISALASDAGSGVDGIEVSKDGGAYTGYTTPITFGDGGHTYQFKATDNAGNVTETSEEEVLVDASGPDISLVEETSLGEILYYEIQDDGSELSTIRFVIGDEDERFEKVAWEDSLSGDYYDDGILWDGKFKDGTQAPVGTYYITISATDNAGNESKKTAAVSVTLLSFLQDIPPFDPPPAPLPAPFGGASRGEGQGEGVSPPAMTFGGTVASRSGSTHTKTDFHMPSAANPITASSSENILWGTAAAAAVGAFLAEAQKKREEEAARQAADRAARLENKDHDAPLSYKQKAKAYQASLDNYKASLIKNGFSEKEASALKSKAVQNGSIPSVASTVAKRERSVALETKMAREDALDEARWETMQEAIKKKAEDRSNAIEAKISREDVADKARWQAMKKANLISEYVAKFSKLVNSPLANSLIRRTVTVGTISLSLIFLTQNCNLPSGTISANSTHTAIYARAGTEVVLQSTQTAQAIMTSQSSASNYTSDIDCVEGYCIGDKLVTGGGLNIRIGAGLNFSTKETLYCGYSVKILEINPYKDAEGRIWARVQTNTNTEGWAAISTLDKSIPTCNDQESTMQTGGGGDVGVIMNGASFEGGNPWNPLQRHFGVDVHSLSDPNIYSLFDDMVVSSDDCASCVNLSSTDGNTTATNNPMEEKYNYGYGAMMVVEYPYENLTDQQLASLKTNGILLKSGQSLYIMEAHLVPGSIPDSGEKLSAGEKAAVMGTSGNSYGEHLHLEAAVNQSGLPLSNDKSTYSYWIKVSGGRYDIQGTRIDPTFLFDMQ